MRFTCAQKRLLSESKWTKCPGCGGEDAYQPLRGDWECPEDDCRFFSQRRKAEVKGAESNSPHLDKYDTFKACEHDLGYFQFDYYCSECGGQRSAVSNGWRDNEDPFLHAMVNNKKVESEYFADDDD